MIRGLLFFAILWVILYVSISGWRNWTAKGAWSVAKLLTYSGVISVLTAAIVGGMVLAF